MKATFVQGHLVVLAASLWAGTVQAQPYEATPGVKPVSAPPALTQPAFVQPARSRPVEWQSVLAQPFETIVPPLPSDAASTPPVVSLQPTAICREDCYRTRIGRRWNTVTKPHLQYSCWGYADLFIDRPFGTYMRGAVNTQVANGLVAQLALYQYDFLNEDGEPDTRLSRRGRFQLERMLHLLPFAQCPIVIEATADSKLNEIRRASVLADLKSLGFAIPDQSVVVGRPRARGMDAIEAIKDYGMMIQSTGIGYGAGDPQAISPAEGSGLGAGIGVLPTPISP